jgi:hypothetical protein
LPWLTSHVSQSQGQSYITTDSQSVVTLQLIVSQSVSLGVEPNLGLLTRGLSFFFFFLKVSVLAFGGALSDERSGLSFVSLQ